jgi:hypothetical protein
MPVSCVPSGAITTPLMVTDSPEIVAPKSDSEGVPFVVEQVATGALAVLGGGAELAVPGPEDREDIDTASAACFFDPLENVVVTKTVYCPSLA